MPGVSREVAEHKLNIKLGSRLLKQGPRCFNQKKYWATGKELSRLLAAGFIKEV
jgi:hypothetical protein